MIYFRQMTTEDIPSGLGLCRSAGWNQLAADWQMFLDMNPAGCTVAVENFRIIGTVTTIHYNHAFGWVGMVLVDPEFRRKGIGSQLLKIAIETLREQSAIRLDATPAGREVYLKLGFADEFELSRMESKATADQPLSTKAQPVEWSDLSDIIRLDVDVFGADRSVLIRSMFKNAESMAFVTKQGKRITGYCFGRVGFNSTHIGPLVADGLQEAQALVMAARAHVENHSTILDIPLNHNDWKEWLTSVGFCEQRRLTRMCRGEFNAPAGNDKQFAILGPEFG